MLQHLASRSTSPLLVLSSSSSHAKEWCPPSPKHHLLENRLPSLAEATEHSSFSCSGGEDDQGNTDWFFRRCVFRNIYYRRSKSRFEYYDSDIPLLLPLTNFSTYFPLPLTRVTTKPSSSSILMNSEEEKCLVVVQECDLGTKVGHDFDSIWNAFNAMLAVRVLDPERIQLVVVGKRHTRNPPPPLSKWWFSLSPRVTRWETFRNTTTSQRFSCVVFANRHKRLVTFPTFLDSYTPQLYLQRALALLLPQAPQQHTKRIRPQILIRYKDRKHGFTNHSLVLDFLQETYSRYCDIYELNATRESSLTQELELIHNADVYITPGGGGSFTGIFIRPGATVLYGNVCWRGLNPALKEFPQEFGIDLWARNGRFVYCYRQDHFVWTLFSHFQKRYISATHVSEVYLPPELETRKAVQRTLRYSLQPNFDQLKMYVDEALIRSGFSPTVTATGRGFPRAQTHKK